MSYLCFHGHFYQPPRENPWLELIEHQPSAVPWHDWNERITAESYRPNSAARIVDAEGGILDIVNNYSRMSFNFGPTLLSWLEVRAPQTYARILEADREGMERFGGHGPAIAQPYNHLIMPLANERDKATQIIWGIADFRHRFGREPEGMWLPETAVDTATLELLAEHGIRFTILEPGQIAATRDRADDGWKPVASRRANVRRVWKCPLPSGRALSVFLYDGPASRAIAFDSLLESGERLAERMLGEAATEDELVHVATDGETYGHHHRFGEMALAWATRVIENSPAKRLTIYGEFLEGHPPEGEVAIVENTSWSCAHGVGRWIDDCGCQTGGEVGWNQKWRRPLRDALDWLRDSIAPVWEREASRVFGDPWSARNDYIHVILDRDRGNVDGWLARHGVEDHDDHVEALELMEIQRHAMLMYTSCGWFFNDVSGIETSQILRYAARAIELSQRRLGLDLRETFVEMLSDAKSNVEDVGSAADVYVGEVGSSVVTHEDVAAHHAVASFFTQTENRSSVGSWSLEWSARKLLRSSETRLLFGVLEVESVVTTERRRFEVAVLNSGSLQFAGGVRALEEDGEGDSTVLFGRVRDLFESHDFGGLIRLLDDELSRAVSLASLFSDARRSVTRHVRDQAFHGSEDELLRLYTHFVPMIRLHREHGIEVSRALLDAAELGINMKVRSVMSEGRPDEEELNRLVSTAEELGLSLDKPMLGWLLEQRLTRVGAEIEVRSPVLVELLGELVILLRVMEILALDVDLWNIETAVFPLVTSEPATNVETQVLEEIAERLGLASRKEEARDERREPREGSALHDGD